MKTFVAPYSIDECKARLFNLSSSGLLGFIKIKLKLIPHGGGHYRYTLWKTMRGNFGEDITLAEVSGDLSFRDEKSTVVSGVSRMGRFYKGMLILYGIVILFYVVSDLFSQKIQYRYGAVFIAGLMGFGWLLTFYWRNQVEGMIERALMQ